MGDCEFVKGCIFFNDRTSIDDSLGTAYKEQYCKGSYNECARFRLTKTLGHEYVPQTLFPTMIDRARQLIAIGK